VKSARGQIGKGPRRDAVAVSLRPVAAADQTTIARWADGVGEYMSRTRPYAPAAEHHDPACGLFWYVITQDGIDVGTVWVELLAEDDEAVLGVFLGDPAWFGRGIGTAAIHLAVAGFRRAHPRVPVVLRVRRTNARAIACYRHAGFTVAGGGTKSLPSGEVVPYIRMEQRPC
jgi:ribosomal protein S18 acetylase RimI-like enzyme